DVREEETAFAAVKATVHRFRRLDGVISNAGIMVRSLVTVCDYNYSMLSTLCNGYLGKRMLQHTATYSSIISTTAKKWRRLHATYTRHTAHAEIHWRPQLSK